jgi:hypothetical protein
MIEIVYNSMVFEILIMEIQPEGAGGISLIDTDLEVCSHQYFSIQYIMWRLSFRLTSPRQKDMWNQSEPHLLPLRLWQAR